MRFPENLRKYRQARGLSQKTLAELINVSREIISKYEIGEREPSLSRAVALSRVLNINLATLVGITNDEILILSTLDPNTRNNIMFI